MDGGPGADRHHHRHGGAGALCDQQEHDERERLTDMATAVQVENLNAWFGASQALYNINLEMPARQTTAVIGPSGCGKSTFVRCLNRMHETVPQATVQGRVVIAGLEVYGKGVSPVGIRRRVGMVFQKPKDRKS